MRELSGEASVIEWSRLLWTTKCADVSIQKVTLLSQKPLHWRGVSGSLITVQVGGEKGEKSSPGRTERGASLSTGMHCCGFRCVSGKVFPSGYKQSPFLIGPETPLWPVANRV